MKGTGQKSKVVTFGKTGNISRAINTLIADCPDFLNVPVGKDSVNFLHPSQIVACLNHHQPDFIINAAAYTAVDKAETERSEAFALNATAPYVIAQWCKDNRARLIHYSTDYVFDGKSDGLINESSPTNPISVYGESKLEGEKLIQESGCTYTILRTSWIFAPEGANFFSTMLNLGLERSRLRIVNDQYGSPTYNYSVAAATLKILSRMAENPGLRSGIYHCTDVGYTTWFKFASTIFDQLRQRRVPLALTDLSSITTEEYGAPAKRPKNSRLDTSKLYNDFQIKLPEWRSDLLTCIEISPLVAQALAEAQSRK